MSLPNKTLRCLTEDELFCAALCRLEDTLEDWLKKPPVNVAEEHAPPFYVLEQARTSARQAFLETVDALYFARVAELLNPDLRPSPVLVPITYQEEQRP